VAKPLSQLHMTPATAAVTQTETEREGGLKHTGPACVKGPACVHRHRDRVAAAQITPNLTLTHAHTSAHTHAFLTLSAKHTHTHTLIRTHCPPPPPYHPHAHRYVGGAGGSAQGQRHTYPTPVRLGHCASPAPTSLAPSSPMLLLSRLACGHPPSQSHTQTQTGREATQGHTHKD
jgi:hypothetical protein